jgi:ABC-type glycerol-3-phosphate transport system substrate-binding protein
LSGDLAFYIGYASEFAELRKRNPNLNFDVAVLPQSRSDEQNISTTGSLVFIAMPKNSPNLSAAYSAIMKLISKENVTEMVSFTNLPPVRRDLLVEQNSNAIMQTFYNAALIVRPFMDPGTLETDRIFSDMIESYTSGRSTMAQVLLRAKSQLVDLIK